MRGATPDRQRPSGVAAAGHAKLAGCRTWGRKSLSGIPFTCQASLRRVIRIDRDEFDMEKSLIKAAGVVAATAALALASPTVATAAGSGADFGQHVRDCAQGTGFDGTHNPGMHHGFTGWDPKHVC